MSIFNTIERPFPPRPASRPDNVEGHFCNFCKKTDDDSIGFHTVRLPVRYRWLECCDDCAMEYSIVTECCGDIG